MDQADNIGFKFSFLVGKMCLWAPLCVIDGHFGDLGNCCFFSSSFPLLLSWANGDLDTSYLLCREIGSCFFCFLFFLFFPIM